jgi:hypothetical protein
MKKNLHALPAAGPKTEFGPKIELIAICSVQGFALILLVWAFHDAADFGLTPDQRLIALWAFALLGGTLGYFVGGVFLRIRGHCGPAVSFAIRATGASALFLAVLFLSPYAGRLDSLTIHPPEERLRVTSPADCSEVGLIAEVRGHTTDPRRFYYVLVTGMVAGGEMVQDSAVEVSQGGNLLAKATIGGAEIGIGEHYQIQFVASKTPLPPGPLVVAPGMLFSPAVSVLRTH